MKDYEFKFKPIKQKAIIACIILVLLPEPLRFIGFPSSIVGPMRQIIYALILILILVYRPRGLYGKVELE